ncbi:hypothetical protein [Legionella qingyii]|uniref:hypothetical protein n=1 Tax=Legionella qingyii TaxID=2184757 RepID=UPI001057B9B4|nr:hypothetical protein [Legionella qingyii]
MGVDIAHAPNGILAMENVLESLQVRSFFAPSLKNFIKVIYGLQDALDKESSYGIAGMVEEKGCLVITVFRDPLQDKHEQTVAMPRNFVVIQRSRFSINN